MLHSSTTVTETALQAELNSLTLSERALVTIIAVAITVAIAILLLLILKKAFHKYTGPITDDVSKEKRTMMRILYSVLRFAVIVIAVLSILSDLGIDISGAFAACGIAAACGALAVQDLLKDLIQGMNIISDRYFSIGDIIEYNGFVGKVTSLTMRSTKIQSLADGSVKTIGNHFLTEVTAVSHCVNLIIPLSYEDDYKYVHQVLKKLSDRIGEYEKVERSSFRGTQAFNDSSITYLITYFCDPETMPQTKRDVNLIVQEALKEAGLEIPFNQLDVHTK